MESVHPLSVFHDVYVRVSVVVRVYCSCCLFHDVHGVFHDVHDVYFVPYVGWLFLFICHGSATFLQSIIAGISLNSYRILIWWFRLG
eukprot:UN02645